MFASWKPIPDSDGRNVLLCKRPHTFDPVTAKTERPVACSQCRAQKVRCTSERNGEGCSRCQALHRKCTYPSRANTAIPGRKTSDYTGTELRSDPPELPTPAPTERSTMSTSPDVRRSVDEWINEPQRSYSNGIDFCNFPLETEFSRYSSFDMMGSCEVQSGQLAPESLLATQGHSLIRTLQHTETYPAAGEPITNRTPRPQARTPQANSLLSDQPRTRSKADVPQTAGVSGCQCLHGVVVLMDEVELLGEPSRDNLPVDGILAAHRKGMRQAESMLACVSCASRVDHMMLLTFLVSKLADLCCRAASTVSPCRASSPTASQASVSEALATSVGTYQIEEEAEYFAIVRALLHLGLDRLLVLVSALQEAGEELGSDTMGRRLGVCKREIGLIIDGR
ncbi:hypothetical protein F5B19DRAFT_251517 [Rostrohypoxylon terebratum]|nr:hypothetical protein F5B19DRAFT_251517 [Rostrohypoxylon terebratum]